MGKICKFDFKFERKKLRRSIREMIFGVLKLKFDEDKACSLSSQILTKSAKSALETSRQDKIKAKIFAVLRCALRSQRSACSSERSEAKLCYEETRRI